MTQPAPARITVGVDTHAEVHVAVAKDSFGRRLDATTVPTTPAGYAELLGWARRLGPINAWGIEGTGSFGAGLTRFLHRHGQRRGQHQGQVDRGRLGAPACRRRPSGHAGQR
jgi:transposase